VATKVGETGTKAAIDTRGEITTKGIEGIKGLLAQVIWKTSLAAVMADSQIAPGALRSSARRTLSVPLNEVRIAVLDAS